MNRRKKVKRLGAKTISFPKGKGHLTHNNREFISNNVVPERTDWNRIYIQESLEQAYEKCFGQALMEYNAGQKRKDRRKENYLKEIENSGNKEKTFYENIVQIGKKDDTPVVGADGKLTEEAKAAIEILEQYAKTFQERNPNLYLFNCVMHLDEATPHLHIDYIPVANGYKTGMKTRNSLTKALQQMGFAKAVSKKENETVAWQQRERAYLTELCQEKGIDVEVLGIQRDNLTLPEYKAAMRKVEKLEHQAVEIEENNQRLAGQAEKLVDQIAKLDEKEKDNKNVLKKYGLRADTLKTIAKETEKDTKKLKSAAIPVSNILGSEEYVKVKKSDWEKIIDAFGRAVSRNKLLEKYEKKIVALEKKVSDVSGLLDKMKQFKGDQMLHHFKGKIDIGTGNGGFLSQLKLQNEMRLTDESWINYQKGKGDEEFQKYMEDLTDMQNHVLLYLQSFCSLEEKGVQERREQQVADKKESRSTAAIGVDKQVNVKDVEKAERKSVPQKKATVGKEKKPSIHERLEINKKIVQEKQGKDKPERGADLGVRTV
jgi:hypothetical protein